MRGDHRFRVADGPRVHQPAVPPERALILDARRRGGRGRAVRHAAPNNQQVNESVQNQLTKSFAGAESVAQQFPQHASQITAAAKQSFLDGADWAYTAGILAVLLGAVLVFLLFPRRDEEERLLAHYHAEDGGQHTGREPERRRAIA